MKDVMLDLETMGNGSNAVIVQIGACYFDRKTGEIGDKFIINVDIESSLSEGFSVSGSTIYWWLNNDKEAIKSIIEGEKTPVKTAINMINDFLRKSECIWSHATFDFVIVMNHFHKLQIKPTFHYRSARDLRTLVDLSKIDHKQYSREGVHHNALDDCIYQVKYAVDCLNVISKNR